MNRYYTILILSVLGYTAQAQTTHTVNVAVNQGSGCPTVTGLDESEFFKVFPNPANASFKIESSLRQGQYKLLNHHGRKVLSGKLTNGRKELDVNSLSPGIYFLQIVSGNRKDQIKISIQ